MRNPLRRAYRQLSRLIVNEGFKDFANLCGFDPKDPDYQEVRDAYDNIQSNKELKDFYKSKMAKAGINISNLDRALYDVSSSDENLSPVEKFLADYEIYSASYKTENRLATLRRERENLKEKFADNVVQQTSQFIVYKVDNFKDAKQMRWLWMGDVEKLTNEQCKKLDPNAPADSQSYGGKKTPKQMAKYMMSNNEFIMNPSWCVCAGEEHWNNYKCGETNKDGSASCHLIFSKKYPNCRFCVVRNSSKFEIRDPWQGGRFGGKNQVRYGYEVMQAVFGNDAVEEIKCLHGVAKKLLTEKLEAEFIGALDEDNVEVTQQLLEQGCDPNYKDEYGVPVIIHAVRHGAVNVCELLLEYGADANAKAEDGDIPLHLAAKEGHTQICKFLIENGAGVNVKDEDGRTPMHRAAGKGRMETCKILLDHGADINAKDEDGRTPLYVAAANGHTEICKLLLEHDADVNVMNQGGWTPLHWAAEKGHTETCKLLLENGAEVNGKNKYDNTPLHWAATNGHTETCELLLLHGADANQKSMYGWTPLHMSAGNGHTEICKQLLLHGADANAKNKQGQTPLHRAAGQGHAATCKLLLKYGADVNATNNGGVTILEMAASYGHTETCELLRQYTARD